MRVLLTAFEPFGESSVNPSQLVLERLRAPAGCELLRQVLPVDTEALPAVLDQLLAAASPELVLCLGEARSSEKFRVERVARNRLCFPRPDNAGRTIASGAVIAGGADELPSTLCVASVMQALERAGVEARFSDDAGGYLCNQLFYSLSHRLALVAPVGFLHLPSLPEQGFGPGVPLDMQVRAVEQVLKSLIVKRRVG